MYRMFRGHCSNSRVAHSMKPKPLQSCLTSIWPRIKNKRSIFYVQLLSKLKILEKKKEDFSFHVCFLVKLISAILKTDCSDLMRKKMCAIISAHNLATGNGNRN